MSSTGMIVDGVFGSEHIDSSGEVLDIKGADITELEEGRGLFSYEHKGHEGNTNGEEIVGRILSAKKIFKASDYANEREKMFWEQVKLPFIYGVGRLYDGAGHSGAQAIAASIRDHAANNEPIVVSFSVEGTTLHRKDNILKETMIRRVAVTTRPCNKATSLGILEDPNAPQGFPKTPTSSPDIAAAVKAEFGDPRFQRLGGSEFVYGPEILKALAAGNYNAAPTSLTGGSALQVEDRTLKARALAAHRDWDKSGKFKDFLKMRMPEVSDDFLDHYSDLVDSQQLRLKKTEEVIKSLKKAGKEIKKPGTTKVPKLSNLVVQGLPVPASKQNHNSFDPVSGTLTTPMGVFQTSTPDQPHPNLIQKLGANASKISTEFQKEMEVQRPSHLKAMKNWLQMNDRYVRGQISPQVLAHAVAFSMMSPGVPVPMQEAMYGHLVDALKAHGVQAPTARNWDSVSEDWLSRNRSGLPEHSRDHFRNLEQQLIASKTGEYRGFNKPNSFSKYFGEYLRDHHADVLNLVRESKGNSHALVRRLSEVRGIQPKLARYMLGMLGAGDIVVPDTHFLRHYFGLQPDPGGRGQTPDEVTKEHIRRSLTASVGSNDLLEKVDQAYARHPAVQHVLNDKTIGPYFKGRENQALFPGFWRHWISIPGHENRIGTPNNQSFNRDTTHIPFWDAVRPMLNKAEESFDADLPIRTAAQHQRWVEQYGAMAALDLFHRYLAPKLMANDTANVQELTQKFENLGIQLRLVLGSIELKKAEPAMVPDEVEFQGQTVKPGKMHLPDKKVLTLLHAGKEYVGVPEEKFKTGQWGHDDLVRLPRNEASMEATQFKGDRLEETEGGTQGERIVQYPTVAGASSVIDLDRDGVGEFNHDPKSRALAHGFDMEGPQEMAMSGGVNQNYSFWATSADGKRVYVKADQYPGAARLEGAYANIARDYFGLGDMVPTVSVFRHPRTGQEHAMIESLSGETGSDDGRSMAPYVKQNTEIVHRAALMNMALGNSDRNTRNFLIGPDGLKLIDHGATFHPDWIGTPYYATEYGGSHLAVHPEAAKWFASLDPTELANHMKRYELPESAVKNAQFRLGMVQDLLKQNPNMPIYDLINEARRLYKARPANMRG